MSKKTIKTTLYMESKIKFVKRELSIIRDPNGYLFSGGVHPTKILPEDLPEWYVYGYMYKRHGYISAKGVKHLLYVPNYTFDNHLHKYDNLYISYGTEIEPYQTEWGYTWYKGYDYVIDGSLMVSFIEAVKKYSDYDVTDIQREAERKRAWYYERNPKT